MRWWNKKNKIS